MSNGEKTAKNSREKVLSILKMKKVAPINELVRYVSRAILLRMVNSGEIISIGSGIYSSTGVDPFVAALITASRYYKHVVISNFTALAIHKLRLSEDFTDFSVKFDPMCPESILTM